MSTPHKRPYNEIVSSEEEDLDDNGTTVDGIYIPPPIPPACSYDTTGPRLIITKINNHFFKSYGPNTTLGPFCKCFNAIVGPNGSGKSNVIDAMLFVFGYRAAKIRSRNTAVLIHNSQGNKTIESCTVTVYFAEIISKEGNDYDIVPGSEFTISRTANKDSSSFYQLNGKKVHFKEIGALLKKHGVDLNNNRFLILQGEVEQIAMMKCKGDNENETGMLEYLEDIIGTDRYKKPLALLEERVEILSEKRNERINRLKLVENELEQLRGPMEEAVGFLKVENTITRCHNVLYQKNIFDLKNKIKEFEGTVNEVETAHKELHEKLEQVSKEKQEKKSILDQQSSKYEELQRREEQLKETFKKANKKDIQLQADMTQMVKTRKKRKEELAAERKHLEKLQQVPEKNEAEIEEIQERQKELTKQKDELEKEKEKILSNIRSETRELQERREIVEKDLDVLRKAADEAKAAYSLAESELKIYRSREEHEKNTLNSIKTEYDELKNKIKERKENIKELKTKIPEAENTKNKLEQQLKIINDEEPGLYETFKEKRIKCEEVKSSMEASRSRGAVLDALMAQKRSGACPGILGRLGDLGGIDKKYDVAVSTACPRLDNIVVDTVPTAEWCIQYLKDHNIGRATFIALDKQEHLRQLANSRIKTPENVPRLYDLVQVNDESIRTAFYFALRDTLVVNDIDQATRIAYGAQRWRVITLGGELIETSGTISGGGNTVIRGKMGQSASADKISPQEMKKMETDMTQIEERIRHLREMRYSVEEQIKNLPDIREMKQTLKNFEYELAGLQELLPKLAEHIKEQEVVCKEKAADPSKVKAFQKNIEKKKVDYENAVEATKGLQQEVDEIIKVIKEKSSGKISVVDNKLKNVVTTIAKCKTEITKLTVGIKTAERNQTISSERIQTMEKDIETMENNLRKMKSEREEIEEDARKLLKAIEEIAAQLTEGEDDYSELKKLIEKLTKTENKLKSDKIDMDEKLKDTKKRMDELEAALEQWTNKLKHLQLEDIPDETQQPLEILTDDKLEEINTENLKKEIKKSEDYLKSQNPNLNAIKEYKQKQNVYMEKTKELDEISERRNEMRKVFDNLTQQRKNEFLDGYEKIKLKLKETYQMLTLGGDADFEMIDTFDPFTQGIQFNVRPPKKSWKNISNLSGGEKTLSSLALVFALHYYKPSPLYVMDEIDAALDFKNVSIVANYIKERTKNAQFIIISLRNNMFELCDYLIGIYKINNITKTIAIDPNAFDDDKDEDKENSVANNENIEMEVAENLEESYITAERNSSTSSNQVIDDSFVGNKELEI